MTTEQTFINKDCEIIGWLVLNSDGFRWVNCSFSFKASEEILRELRNMKK